MAKRSTTSVPTTSKKSVAKGVVKSTSPIPAAVAVASTPVRNSPVPSPARVGGKAEKKEVTREQIAARAYAIWQSGQGGSEVENWLRAERELKG